MNQATQAAPGDDRRLSSVHRRLKDRLLAALEGSKTELDSKEAIRVRHASQRRERSEAESRLVALRGRELLAYFADGSEVDPSEIRPRLVHIERADSKEGHLFRLATLLWSVPVSHGYGRRLRFLVIDEQNGKLIGLLALGDPVFNLACRDAWIGWTVQQREARLSFALDAYVLGAVPPYSFMLGGKLVASLVASDEIRDIFQHRYGNKPGLISERAKNPKLVLVTTTSSLGKSSLYNRLRLKGIVEFQPIGLTGGWGHFGVSEDLFRDLRTFLREQGSQYHNNYEFSQGPNWRLRAIRKAASLLCIEEDILRHGIQREVFGVPLASNWREVLIGADSKVVQSQLPTDVIAEAALERWVRPRAERRPEWKDWSRLDTWRLLTNQLPSQASNTPD